MSSNLVFAIWPCRREDVASRMDNSEFCARSSDGQTVANRDIERLSSETKENMSHPASLVLKEFCGLFKKLFAGIVHKRAEGNRKTFNNGDMFHRSDVLLCLVPAESERNFPPPNKLPIPCFQCLSDLIKKRTKTTIQLHCNFHTTGTSLKWLKTQELWCRCSTTYDRAQQKSCPIAWGKKIFLLGKQISAVTYPMGRRSWMFSWHVRKLTELWAHLK